MTHALLDKPAAEPLLDDATRRQFLAGLAAAGLLVGCGDERAPGPLSAPSSQLRSVSTARGDIDIPTRPERLLALDLLALALGVPVAGAAFTGLDDPDVDHLRDRLGQIRPVSSADGISLEQVASARPDLVLAADDPFYDGLYRELSAIAPTVLDPEFGNAGRWRQIADVQAELLAGREAAQQLAVRYDEHAARTRQSLARSTAGASAQLLNVHATEAYLYLADSYAGQVMTDAGLTLSSTQPVSGFTQTLSLEQVGRADADVLFVLVASSDEDRAAYDALRASELWSLLPAAQDGRVFEVPPRWIRSGYLAAGQVLDDLSAMLTPEGS